MLKWRDMKLSVKMVNSESSFICLSSTSAYPLVIKHRELENHYVYIMEKNNEQHYKW